MNRRLDPVAFGTAAALVAGLVMLLLGVFGNLGVYTGAVEAMEQWHLFFSLTPAGVVAGIVEAAASTFVLAFVFAWLYDALERAG